MMKLRRSNLVDVLVRSVRCHTARIERRLARGRKTKKFTLTVGAFGGKHGS